jgi:hypothetical protein
MRSSGNSGFDRRVEDISGEKDESFSLIPSIAHPDVLFSLGPLISDFIKRMGELSYGDILLFLWACRWSIWVVSFSIPSFVSGWSIVPKSAEERSVSAMA